MRPVLFSVGDLHVGTHDFFVLLGVAAATAVFLFEARRRRVLGEDLLWVVVGTLFCGAIAAKAGGLWNLVSDTGGPGSAAETIARGGRTILGGLAGAYLGAVTTKRIVGYRAKTGDLFAPAVALGMAVGRWGCFLTEQVGTTTSMPWGITVSDAAAARIPDCAACTTGLPMHPSFLYEIAFHALAFGVLVRNRDRIPVPGELLKIYLFAYAVFRFGVEFVRGNDVVVAGLTRSQLFLIPSALLLGGYLVRQIRRGAYGRLEVATT
ncbi:MAG: prolipoprotein diacylglyceryl transferase [Actinomycetota bacterium]